MERGEESLAAKEVQCGNLASRIINIDGKVVGNEGLLRKVMPNVNMAAPGTFVTPIYGENSTKTPCETNNHEGSGDKVCGDKPSFVSVFKERTPPKAVRLTKMQNSEVVDGAHVTIPLTVVEEVSNHFKNTLYGYFIRKRLAFPLVENYVKNAWAKYRLERTILKKGFFFFQFATSEGMEQVLENGPWLIRLVPVFLNIWTPNTRLSKEAITNAPIWVKLHNVPVVAYSEKSWGRNDYARALIEVSSITSLKESVVVAIPFPNGSEHSLEIVDKPKVAAAPVVEDDGFMKVTRKKGKGKSKQDGNNRQVVGIKLTKPMPNLLYRVVQKKSDPSEASTSNQANDGKLANEGPVRKTSFINDEIDVMPLKNSFETLMEADKVLDSAVVDKGPNEDAY
ncbi:zinc knuckle CX2CX4HX4C containing protein [Tanacetum coccineum]